MNWPLRANIWCSKYFSIEHKCDHSRIRMATEKSEEYHLCTYGLEAWELLCLRVSDFSVISGQIELILRDTIGEGTQSLL